MDDSSHKAALIERLADEGLELARDAVQRVLGRTVDSGLVTSMVQRGELEAVKVGRRWWTSTAAVRRALRVAGVRRRRA